MLEKIHDDFVIPTFVVKCTFAARDLVLAKYVRTHFESNAELLAALAQG